jgi:hypothetical protein
MSKYKQLGNIRAAEEHNLLSIFLKAQTVKHLQIT